MCDSMHATHGQTKQCFVIITCLAFTFAYDIEFVYPNEIRCISQFEIKSGEWHEKEKSVVCHNLRSKMTSISRNISQTLEGSSKVAKGICPKSEVYTSCANCKIKKCVRVTKTGMEANNTWPQHQAQYREMHMPDIFLNSSTK